MTKQLTVETTIHFNRRGKRKELRRGEKQETVGIGRVPRVARLMALAIRFEQLITSGEAWDYAELARLAHVSRARITQIMNLQLLGPDIQEAILFLPAVERGRDGIHLRQLHPIALVADWRKQRKLWQITSKRS